MNISFGSLREDNNRLRILTEGKKSLTPPNARLIHQSIKNLRKETSKKSLDYLFSVAENNKYGISQNSALRKYLEKKSSIAKSAIENNHWDAELKNAIKIAIKYQPKNEQELLLKRFNRLFIEQKQLTREEKNLIKYREYILKTKDFKSAFYSKNKPKKEMAQKAIKHLDFFIASSETSIKEKTYVLSKLARFMSDKYKINPQLKDKKLQAFSEIINDLVIKEPNNPILTTKNCSQEQHGCCAAISMARKALLYEDKQAYIDTVLNELDDKDYMEIYDVTRLLEYYGNEKKLSKERAPKIKVNKAKIDYNRALKEGYRIIDTSVLNWMKIAGTVGDGTIELEDYIPFDSENNGFLRDSRIIKDHDNNYIEEHKLLRILIKSKNRLKNYEKDQLEKKIKQHEFAQDKDYLAKRIATAHREIESIIKPILPENSENKINTAISNIIKDEKINTKNTENILKEQITEYFSKKLGSEYKKELIAKEKELLTPVKDYIKFSKKYNSNISTYATKANEARKLYKLGIAHHEILKQLLNINGYVDFYYENLNLPDRATQIKNQTRELKNLLQTKPNSEKITNLKSKLKVDNTKLLEILNTYDDNLTTQIPQKIDKKLGVYKTSIKNLLVNFVDSAIERHKQNDLSFMESYTRKHNKNISPEKFEEILYQTKKDLLSAKNNEELTSTISKLCNVNQYEIITEYIESKNQDLVDMIKSNELEKTLKKTNSQLQKKEIDSATKFITKTNQEIMNLANYHELVANKIGYPDPKTVIISKAEKIGALPRKKIIDELSAKFDEIDKARKYKKKQKELGIHYTIPNELYVFTKEQKETLDLIKKTLPEFKRDINRSYKIANNGIKETLENLYENLGKRKGFFWIGEEGHSGLYDQESIRIAEQMTGKPYYNEADIDVAVEKIKNGHGSGTSSTMVSYNEYSGHAQYIADIKPVKFKDPKTGKTISKDVIFHDNTWGKDEKKYSWIDDLGIQRTNYGNDYGGPKGFILDDSLLQGEFVEDYKWDTGLNVSQKDNKATSGAFLEIKEDATPYLIMDSIRLQGISPKAVTKIKEMYARLFNLSNVDKKIDELIEASIIAKNEINIKKISSLDTILQNKTNELETRLVKNEKPTMTIEEYNNLPENDILKVIINKIIIRKAFPALEHNQKLSDIKTQKGLDKFKEKILQEYKDTLYDILGKNITSYASDITANIEPNLKTKIEKIEKLENVDLSNLNTQLISVIEKVLEKSYDGSSLTLLNKLDEKVAKYLQKNKTTANLPKKYHREIIKQIKKSTSEIIYPKNMEEIAESGLNKEIIKIIDKFKPHTDEEIIPIIHNLIKKPRKDISKFVDNLTLADFGVNFDTPENIVKDIQVDRQNTKKLFENEIRYHFYNEFSDTKANKNGSYTVSKELADFNRKYRSFAIDISSIGGEKYIKEAKESFFEKYQARPAIPSIQIKTQEELEEILSDFINDMITQTIQTKNLYLAKNYITYLNKLNEQTKTINDDLNIEEIQNTLKNILETTLQDNSFAHVSANTKKIIDEMESGKINKNKIIKFANYINKETEKLLKDLTLDFVNSSLDNAKTQLSTMKTMIEANILPKYQAQAHHHLNVCLKRYTKDPKNPANRETAAQTVEFLAKKHILTDPEELLNYTIKVATEPENEAKKEINEYILDTLKSYLKECYKKANKAHLEYELMSAARNGFASKTKDLIKRFGLKLKLSDGSYIDSFDPKGMEFIIASLADTGSNHSTLMLFLEQAGLIDSFLKTMYKLPPQKLEKRVAQLTKKYIKGNKEIQKLQNKFDAYIKILPEDIIYRTTDDDELIKSILINYSEYLDNTKPEDKANFITEGYKEMIMGIEVEAKKAVKIKDIITYCHDITIESLKNKMYSVIGEINQTCEAINTRYSLMQNLKLAKDSEDDIKRNNYLEELNKVSNNVNKYSELICNSQN